MSKRSIALAFALIVGVNDLKAQGVGPFVRGRQYATMRQFDAAVVDWLVSKSSGKGEVALRDGGHQPKRQRSGDDSREGVVCLTIRGGRV